MNSKRSKADGSVHKIKHEKLHKGESNKPRTKGQTSKDTYSTQNSLPLEKEKKENLTLTICKSGLNKDDDCFVKKKKSVKLQPLSDTSSSSDATSDSDSTVTPKKTSKSCNKTSTSVISKDNCAYNSVHNDVSCSAKKLDADTSCKTSVRKRKADISISPTENVSKKKSEIDISLDSDVTSALCSNAKCEVPTDFNSNKSVRHALNSKEKSPLFTSSENSFSKPLKSGAIKRAKVSKKIFNSDRFIDSQKNGNKSPSKISNASKKFVETVDKNEECVSSTQHSQNVIEQVSVSDSNLCALNSTSSPKCLNSPKKSEVTRINSRRLSITVNLTDESLNMTDTDKITSPSSRVNDSWSLPDIEIHLEDLPNLTENLKAVENESDCELHSLSKEPAGKNCHILDEVMLNNLDSSNSKNCLSLLNQELKATKAPERYMILNQLGSHPVFKPENFDYDVECDIFNFEVDLSSIKAANNYLMKNFSRTEPPLVNSRAFDFSSMEWQDSTKPSDISSEILNFSNLGDSDIIFHTNLEDGISLVSVNANDIQLDIFEMSDDMTSGKAIENFQVNPNPVSSDLDLVYSDDLNVGKNVTVGSDSLTLSPEDLVDFNFSSPKVSPKKLKRRTLPYSRKRVCRKSNSKKNIFSESQSYISNEEYCDTYDECETKEFAISEPSACSADIEGVLLSTENVSVVDNIVNVSSFLCNTTEELYENASFNKLLGEMPASKICEVSSETDKLNVLPNMPLEVKGNKSSPNAKRRRRCIWDTKKRRCKKNKSKQTQAFGTFNSTEILCDTCDEAELDVVKDGNCLELETKNSLKPSIKTGNLNTTDCDQTDKEECSKENLISKSKDTQEFKTGEIFCDTCDEDEFEDQVKDKKHLDLQNKNLRSGKEIENLNNFEYIQTRKSTRLQKCRKKNTISKSMKTELVGTLNTGEIFCDTCDEDEFEDQVKDKKHLDLQNKNLRSGKEIENLNNFEYIQTRKSTRLQKCRKKNTISKSMKTELVGTLNTEEIFCDTCDGDELEDQVNGEKTMAVQNEILRSNKKTEDLNSIKYIETRSVKQQNCRKKVTFSTSKDNHILETFNTKEISCDKDQFEDQAIGEKCMDLQNQILTSNEKTEYSSNIESIQTRKSERQQKCREKYTVSEAKDTGLSEAFNSEEILCDTCDEDELVEDGVKGEECMDLQNKILRSNKMITDLDDNESIQTRKSSQFKQHHRQNLNDKFPKDKVDASKKDSSDIENSSVTPDNAILMLNSRETNGIEVFDIGQDEPDTQKVCEEKAVEELGIQKQLDNKLLVINIEPLELATYKHFNCDKPCASNEVHEENIFENSDSIGKCTTDSPKEFFFQDSQSHSNSNMVSVCTPPKDFETELNKNNAVVQSHVVFTKTLPLLNVPSTTDDHSAVIVSNCNALQEHEKLSTIYNETYVSSVPFIESVNSLNLHENISELQHSDQHSSEKIFKKKSSEKETKKRKKCDAYCVDTVSCATEDFKIKKKKKSSEFSNVKLSPNKVHNNNLEVLKTSKESAEKRSKLVVPAKNNQTSHEAMTSVDHNTVSKTSVVDVRVINSKVTTEILKDPEDKRERNKDIPVIEEINSAPTPLNGILKVKKPRKKKQNEKIVKFCSTPVKIQNSHSTFRHPEMPQSSDSEFSCNSKAKEDKDVSVEESVSSTHEFKKSILNSPKGMLDSSIKTSIDNKSPKCKEPTVKKQKREKNNSPKNVTRSGDIVKISELEKKNKTQKGIMKDITSPKNSKSGITEKSKKCETKGNVSNSLSLSTTSGDHVKVSNVISEMFDRQINVKNMKRIPKISQKKQTNSFDNSCDLFQPQERKTEKLNSNEHLGDLEDITASETVILMDDDLDFEPDNFEDAYADNHTTSFSSEYVSSDKNLISVLQKDSRVTSMSEFDAISQPSCSNSNVEAFSSPSFIEPTTFTSENINNLSRYRMVLQTQNGLSEDESDSDHESNFKRRQKDKSSLSEPVPRIVKKDINLYSHKDTLITQNGNVASKILEKDNRQHNFEISDSAKSPIHSHQTMKPTEEKSTENKSECVNSSFFNSVPQPKAQRLEDVILKIQDCCCKKLVDEAINLAQEYIAISCSYETNSSIIQKLFSNLLTLYVKNYDFSVISTFQKVLKLINDYELYGKKICSMFIFSCCSHSRLAIYAIKMYHACLERGIPMTSHAINKFGLLLKLEDVTPDVILDFFEYIKSICKRKMPKELVHLTIRKCQKKYQYKVCCRLCLLLHGISSKEIDPPNLQDFLMMCFSNGMSENIADIFLSWDSKYDLLGVLYSSLVADHKSCSQNYKKLINALYGQENRLPLQQKHFISQVGTALMLTAYNNCDHESALEILYALHEHNVNYFELQQQSCSSYLNVYEDSSKDMEFPYVVVFSAVDICLHCHRPKDAYTVLEDFSWISCYEKLDPDVKENVAHVRFQHLLQLAKCLCYDKSLNEGFQTLKVLLSAIQKDVSETDLTASSKGLKVIFNRFIIRLLNNQNISRAMDLYQYSLGPHKAIFDVLPNVFRGLVTSLSENGMVEEAKQMFMLGILRKIYSIEKPQPDTIPWNMTVISYWTVHEIKIAVEWFLDDLFPLLMYRPLKTKFEDWFSMIIHFKFSNVPNKKIKCLQQSASEPGYLFKKVKAALDLMHLSLIVENIEENFLCITPKSLYDCWKAKCPNASPKCTLLSKNILEPVDKKISFGKEMSPAKIVSLNSPSNNQQDSRTMQSSPSSFSALHKSSGISSSILNTAKSYVGKLDCAKQSFSSPKQISAKSSNSPSSATKCYSPVSPAYRGSSEFLNSSPSNFGKQSPLGISDSLSALDEQSFIKPIDQINSKVIKSSPVSTKHKASNILKLSPSSQSTKLIITPIEKQKDVPLTESKIANNFRKIKLKKNISRESSIVESRSNMKNSHISVQSKTSTPKTINAKINKKFENFTVSLSSGTSSRTILNYSHGSLDQSGAKFSPNVQSTKEPSPKILKVAASDISCSVSTSSEKESTITSTEAKSVLTKSPEQHVPKIIRNVSQTVPGNAKNSSLHKRIFVSGTPGTKPKPIIRTFTSSVCGSTSDRISTEIVPKSESSRETLLEKNSPLKSINSTKPCTSTSSCESTLTCNLNELNKIIQFLKIKISQNYKNLTSDEQHEKAVTLARTFVKENCVIKMEKRTMKLLNEFATSRV